MRLRPFFSYYGAKYRLALKYPKPTCNKIIEPFAGSATYALTHPHIEVSLSDVDPVIVGVWDFLINAPESDVSALPDYVFSVDDIKADQEAKWLVGFWLSPGSSTPKKSMSSWGQKFIHAKAGCFWSPQIKNRIREQQRFIRHWRIRQASYSDVLNEKATWFVDPPYSEAGRHYKHSQVDYSDLSVWCRERDGQIIVCENAGANWLPFTPFAVAAATSKVKGQSAKSYEAIWTKGCE